MLTGKDGEGCFSVLGLKRGYEDPVFEGSLTILRRKEGFLLINELPLESYIRKVIPSEMPSSYPLGGTEGPGGLCPYLCGEADGKSPDGGGYPCGRG